MRAGPLFSVPAGCIISAVGRELLEVILTPGWLAVIHSIWKQLPTTKESFTKPRLNVLPTQLSFIEPPNACDDTNTPTTEVRGAGMERENSLKQLWLNAS